MASVRQPPVALPTGCGAILDHIKTKKAMRVVELALAKVKEATGIVWGSRDKGRESRIAKCDMQEGLLRFADLDIELRISSSRRGVMLLDMYVPLPPVSWASLKRKNLLMKVFWLEGIASPDLDLFGDPSVIGVKVSVPVANIGDDVFEDLLWNLHTTRSDILRAYKESGLVPPNEP